MKQKEWIVPPGLRSTVDEFLLHCVVAEAEPILISGASGVGKSLFIEWYRAFYETNIGKIGKDHPFVVLNCAHWGQGDANMALSEIFGYVKGAYTGGDPKGKEGWVSKCKNGALILDEIGSLPVSTQEMLLTFIETGEYTKIGSTKIETIKNIKIVGLKNDLTAELRPDFKNRFFEFRIPPLHERRSDILYHLGHEFPEILSDLKDWELTALLGYNWTGNVRELRAVAHQIERNLLLEQLPRYIEKRVDTLSFGLLWNLNDLNIEKFWDLKYFVEPLFDNPKFKLILDKTGVSLPRKKLINQKRDVKLIDAEKLNQRPKPAVEPTEAEKKIQSIMQNTDIKFCQDEMWANKSWTKFMFFLDTFQLNEMSSENLFSVEGIKCAIGKNIYVDMTEGGTRQYAALQESILELFTDESSPDGNLSVMSWVEIQQKYFKALLDKAGGNKAKAARLAGLPENTFKDKLKKIAQAQTVPPI